MDRLREAIDYYRATQQAAANKPKSAKDCRAGEFFHQGGCHKRPTLKARTSHGRTTHAKPIPVTPGGMPPEEIGVGLKKSPFSGSAAHLRFVRSKATKKPATQPEKPVIHIKPKAKHPEPVFKPPVGRLIKHHKKVPVGRLISYTPARRPLKTA